MSAQVITADPIRILVIIVTYNGRDDIESCLAPLFPKRPEVDILVIDNGSTDGTPECVRGKYPEVEIIEKQENSGFGAANNIGIRYALKKGYDYVYLLNQDAWIAAEDIVRMATIQKAHPQFGILSPLHVYRGKTRVDKAFYNALPRDLLNDAVVDLDDRPDIYVTSHMVQAAHWLVPCEVIKKVGCFSPAFFHYGEDHNFCHRVWFWGYKIGIVPSVKGVHDREHRINTTSKQLLLLGQRWRYFLSNPTVSNKRAAKMIVDSAFDALGKYGVKALKPIPSFVKDVKRILRLKEMSRRPGAFLDELTKNEE